MANKKELDMTSEELFAKALGYERMAIDMKKIGDFAAARAFSGMAEACLADAAGRE
jgi:hypothetical protein